ncbi:MAG: CPBP family intramembrane metalloprotease [Defluviitaleaceae bacterium]|nr:CPBP family intramembrane metalloprotease [Defluviitaleaceae bacterium]
MILITALSLLACIAHGIMLYTPFNDYLYTSAVKLVLFAACPVVYLRACSASFPHRLCGRFSAIRRHLLLTYPAGTRHRRFLNWRKIASQIQWEKDTEQALAVSKDGTLRDMFFREFNTKAVMYSAAFGVAVAAAMFAGFLIVRPWLDPPMIVGAMSNVGITPGNYAVVAGYYIFVNVALEELFFRGFIFLTLYRMGHVLYAHIYSSLLFAVYHVAIMRYGVTPELLILSTIGLVAVGLLFNEITRRCGSLAGSWIVHLCASLSISIIGFHLILNYA